MYITTSKGASMMEDVQMFHDSHETFDLPFSFVQIVVLLELRNRQHVLIDFRVV